MYKNKLLTLFLLIFTVLLNGQEFPSEKTPNHILVNGTNISMVPPLNFELSKNFKGFQNPEDPTSMIMILEIPGPFSEVSKGFSQDLVGKQGMTINSKKSVTIANKRGYLINLSQIANEIEFTKHILAYGDENNTILINGVFPKQNSNLDVQIEKSILSTFIAENIDVNPRTNLDYSINEEAGNLKFNSVTGNGMLFNRDLKRPTESPDKVALITDKSFSKIEIKDKKLFCISRLKKYPEDFSVIIEKGINPIEIDNLKGFEIYAKNNDKTNEEMYQVIIFDEEGGYYLFVGTHLKNHQKALNDIQNVVKTFKRKL